MKTAFLYLLLCISTQFQNIQADWFKFENNDISIEFPKQPQISIQSVPSAIGDLSLDIASYDGSKDGDSNYAYLLMSSAYPDSLINSSKKELLPDFFRRSIDGAVTSVGGKLLSEKEVTFNGYPGREVRVDYGSGMAVIFLHMFLVKNTMYMVQTITETSKENNVDVQRFHGSFKLKK